MKVEWDSFQCHESDGYVQKFLLFFCEAETLENCTGEKGLSEDLIFLFLHLSNLITVNTMCHFYYYSSVFVGNDLLIFTITGYKLSSGQLFYINGKC